ncbi:hypothetical protein KGO95_02015 [Patescibacteria group bacterium]|nr:hypothetical protein [Patescibacteria group bacterium]
MDTEMEQVAIEILKDYVGGEDITDCPWNCYANILAALKGDLANKAIHWVAMAPVVGGVHALLPEESWTEWAIKQIVEWFLKSVQLNSWMDALGDQGCDILAEGLGKFLGEKAIPEKLQPESDLGDKAKEKLAKKAAGKIIDKLKDKIGDLIDNGDLEIDGMSGDMLSSMDLDANAEECGCNVDFFIMFSPESGRMMISGICRKPKSLKHKSVNHCCERFVNLVAQLDPTTKKWDVISHGDHPLVKK